MSNPLFAALNGGTAQPAMLNMQNALAQLKANPAAILRQAGLNVPDGMNNPQQIVNHLLQSGQVNQNRLAQAQQAAMQYRR
jgi:hypothetical protein